MKYPYAELGHIEANGASLCLYFHKIFRPGQKNHLQIGPPV